MDRFEWLRKKADNPISRKLVDEIEEDKRLVECEGKIIKDDTERV